MKKIFTLLLCFFPVAFAQAQAFGNQEEFQASKQFGVVASTISGTGIYYLAPITKKDNFKIAGIYIYDSDNDYADSFFSLGAEFQRDFYETRMRRAYFLVGTSIDNSISSDTFFFDYEDERNTSSFNLGVGVGADLGDRGRGLIINFHLSYQLTQGFKDSDQTRVGLGAGIALGFNF